MALAEHLGDDSWQVVCAACCPCHWDLTVHLYITFVKIYLSLAWHQESRGKVLKCAFTYDRV